MVTPNPARQVTEAVYDNGVLRPTTPLTLRDHQRVRLTVETLEPGSTDARADAMQRLRAGIASMNFTSASPFPSRDELHDRKGRP